MKGLLYAGAVWMFVPGGFALADKVDVTTRLRQIDEQYFKAIREAQTAAQSTSDAVKQRTEALKALVQEVESSGTDDIDGLAELYGHVNRHEDAVRLAEQAIEKNPQSERSHVRLITSLAALGRAEAADAAFEAANKRFIDSPRFASLHYMLISANVRARRPEKAAEHLAVYLDQQANQVSRNYYLASNILILADSVIAAYQSAGKPEGVLEPLDRCLAAIGQSGNSAPAAHAAAQLLGRKVVLLASVGREDEARAALDAELTQARQRHDQRPDDVAATLRVAALLQAQLRLSVGKDMPAEARANYIEFFTEQLKRHVESAEAVEALLSGHRALLNELTANRNTELADSLLTPTEELLKDLKPENKQVADRLKQTGSLLSSLALRIRREKIHAELIGQSWTPIQNAAWVNGSTLIPEELQGKVVLLDFWAVWCGPCIATFPHLRDWHDRYGDRGLVIIGVTNHYGYGWDEVNERPVRVENLSHADEQAAMVQFARHHKLAHTFAVMPDNELSRKYGVTGIPQAVVIDRAGKVRLIRVGSGEPNAKDLEEAIQAALAEPAAAARAGVSD